MTLITDYSSLQAAVIEYLSRDEDTTLISRVPTFVQLFENKANRDLSCRQMETRSTTFTDPTAGEPEYIALPDDYMNMRRIRITAGAARRPQLSFLSPVQADEFRTARGDAPGMPRFFTIFGNEIELVPTPDAIYRIEMIYRAAIPSLSNTVPTNWLLNVAPDLYLYGALMEATSYIKNDARITTWAQLMVNARDSLNQESMDAEFNAGPIQVRTSGPTP